MTREEIEALAAQIEAGLSEDTVETPAPFELKTARDKVARALDSQPEQGGDVEEDDRQDQKGEEDWPERLYVAIDPPLSLPRRYVGSTENHWLDAYEVREYVPAQASPQALLERLAGELGERAKACCDEANQLEAEGHREGRNAQINAAHGYESAANRLREEAEGLPRPDSISSRDPGQGEAEGLGEGGPTIKDVEALFEEARREANREEARAEAAEAKAQRYEKALKVADDLAATALKEGTAQDWHTDVRSLREVIAATLPPESQEESEKPNGWSLIHKAHADRERVSVCLKHEPFLHAFGWVEVIDDDGFELIGPSFRNRYQWGDVTAAWLWGQAPDPCPHCAFGHAYEESREAGND